MPAVCRSTRPPTEGKQLDELFGVQTLLWGAINPRACASVLAAMLGRGYPSRPPFRLCPTFGTAPCTVRYSLWLDVKKRCIDASGRDVAWGLAGEFGIGGAAGKDVVWSASCGSQRAAQVIIARRR